MSGSIPKEGSRMSVGDMTRRCFLALGALAQGCAQVAVGWAYRLELPSPSRHVDTLTAAA